MIPRERLYLNISSSNTYSLSGKRHLLLVVGDATSYMWSVFLKNKLTSRKMSWNQLQPQDIREENQVHMLQ